ncbi:MAG: exo-alpha-sialidase [Phycisphaerae bacterium]|nr:exo-alpha-sialidase [Phycisphaerae bacterium]
MRRTPTTTQAISLPAKSVTLLAAVAAIGLSVAARSSVGTEPAIEWTQITSNAGGAKGALVLASGAILATRPHWIEKEIHVVCARSADSGKSWTGDAIIAREKSPADLGDGHLIQLPTGEILYSYRHNVFGATRGEPRRFSIRVAVSHDDGRTWRPHSTVAESTHDPAEEPKALRGLWSSFLLLCRDGTLHCVYDDEDTPHREGFVRHQWLTMKTWDPAARAWDKPVTVSRARDPKHLSRDGMPSIVELTPGKLLCAFESVQVAPPHANCIRYVTSDDGGKTWSWQTDGRGLLYEPANDHLAISPWLARFGKDRLICVFATDEDALEPSKAGTSPRRMRTDIKYVRSDDGGRSWSKPAQTIFNQTHRSYAPGVVLLKNRSLLVTFLDYARYDYHASLGTLRE